MVVSKIFYPNGRCVFFSGDLPWSNPKKNHLRATYRRRGRTGRRRGGHLAFCGVNLPRVKKWGFEWCRWVPLGFGDFCGLKSCILDNFCLGMYWLPWKYWDVDWCFFTDSLPTKMFIIPWVLPPPSNSDHKDYYMFSRGFLLTFTFHCYREGAISKLYLFLVRMKHLIVRPTSVNLPAKIPKESLGSW